MALLGLVLALQPAVQARAATKDKQSAKTTSKAQVSKSKASGTSKAAKPIKAIKSSKSATSSRPAKAGAVAGPGLRPSKASSRRSLVRLPPPPPSMGHQYGLQATQDELDLRSSVALVIDQDTDEVLFSKNPHAVLPIASITKLMTALVVTRAGLSLDELLTVSQEDVQATAGNRSRLSEGTQLSRRDMLHLSLMASENRAAHVLGRTFPGGMQQFVGKMNETAQGLGMSKTSYVEPTGLSPSNQSTAQDLTLLVKAAFNHPVIRELSTSQEMDLPMGNKTVQFRNTNGLVRNPEWDIGLQKTGYISAAGRCLVMQAQMAGRKLILVLLDSAGRYSRIGDAERLRRWLEPAAVLGVMR